MELSFLEHNDNFITSVHLDSDAKINVRTWDERYVVINFIECGQFQSFGSANLEIGRIEKRALDPFSDWAKPFIEENKDLTDYFEVIFYNAWDSDRINIRLIAEKITIN